MSIGEKRDKPLEFIMKSFLAGGVAGMVAKSSVAPLDRVKILLQGQHHQYKHLGVLECFSSVVKKEKLRALYKGNGAQMIRIFPYAAVQFSSFELYKQMFANLLGSKSHIGRFLSGSFAGVTAVTLTYPLDMVRARLAFQFSGQHIYRGIGHVLVSVFRDEGGLKAFYRGFAPTIIGMIPYAGISFYCFESMKFVCMSYFPAICTEPCPQNTGGLVLILPAKLFCGAVAGAIAQSVSYPLDVTRRKMQLSMMDPSMQKYSNNWTKVLVLIFREDGIVKGLYRGMSINYMRAVPMVAISFSTYELMKQFLNMDTGLAIKT